MPMHKGGKKNRKHGRGQDKVKRSRHGSYAAIFAASRERKQTRLAHRRCPLCSAYCQSMGALKRHVERGCVREG